MAHNHLVSGKESLSPALIKKQNRTDEDLEMIVELHGELHLAFDEMEKVDLQKDLGAQHLKDLALVVKEIEFRLQEAWGFKRNSNNHSWWFQVPHCLCPQLDNWDRVGTEYAIIVGNCPIHGGNYE